MDTVSTMLRSFALSTPRAGRESEDAYYARNSGAKHGLRALLRRAQR